MPPGCTPNSPGNPKVSPWGRTKLPKSSIVSAGEDSTFTYGLPPPATPSSRRGEKRNPLPRSPPGEGDAGSVISGYFDLTSFLKPR